MLAQSARVLCSFSGRRWDGRSSGSFCRRLLEGGVRGEAGVFGPLAAAFCRGLPPFVSVRFLPQPLELAREQTMRDVGMARRGDVVKEKARGPSNGGQAHVEIVVRAQVRCCLLSLCRKSIISKGNFHFCSTAPSVSLQSPETASRRRRLRMSIPTRHVIAS